LALSRQTFKVFGDIQADLSVTERIWPRLLTLPLYPGMTEEEFETVVSEIINFGKIKGL